MNFIGIGNARYVEPTETLLDLELETDEGIIPFTFDPSDTAPATEYVRGILSTITPTPYEAPPPPSLEEVKASKKSEIAALRWDEMSQPTLVEGYSQLWYSDKDSMNDMLRASLDLQTAISLGYFPSDYSLQWKTADGSFTNITLEDLINLRLLLSQRQQSLYIKEALLIDQINAATTVNDVELISWSD